MITSDDCPMVLTKGQVIFAKPRSNRQRKLMLKSGWYAHSTLFGDCLIKFNWDQDLEDNSKKYKIIEERNE